jgi:hypothetical protein
LKEWYIQMTPGKIIMPSHLLCPFCKQYPHVKTLKKFNKSTCQIVHRKRLELRADMYYAWCRECYGIKEAIARECAGQMPKIENFVCQDCQDSKDPPQSKKCPGCDASTTKASSCNHITCLCGTHWCFQCAEEFDEDTIYDHMSEEHGGLGFEYMIEEP